MERVSAYTVGRNIRQLDKMAKKLEINVFKSRNCKIRIWLPGVLISSSETDCYSKASPFLGDISLIRTSA